MSNHDFELDLQDGQNPLIVIASNRGPFQFSQDANGNFIHRRGAGGLVTALSALAERLEVLWVAAALSDADKAWSEQQKGEVQRVDGIDLRLVITDSDQYEAYYNVIANPLLWFIQHQMWDVAYNPSIDAHIWDSWRDGYIAINRQFAEAIAESVRETVHKHKRKVIVFPQDYHLYMVPHFLRQMLGDAVQIQPFVHIPWPGPDGWRILPSEMRDTLLRSMLASDRIGFQTQSDAFNFVQTCRFYLKDAHSYGARDSITYKDRKVGAYAYPISVDVQKVDSLVNEAATRLQKQQIINLIGDRKLILRTDRVEPSKNIIRGLQAFRALLETYPEHRDKVQMVALLVPSRMAVFEYQNYLRDIMAEAGMINADYSTEFWEPVRVIVGDNYQRALAAMQLYDVLLVNPIADGMNLVAKEGVLINQRDGVLLLSEHAGAFYELGEHALSVSPYDIYGTAYQMNKALMMSGDERKRRARSLEQIVRGADVRAWFYHQIADALKASNNQEKNDSTPSTPGTSTSDDSATTEGMSSDETPIPNE